MCVLSNLGFWDTESIIPILGLLWVSPKPRSIKLYFSFYYIVVSYLLSFSKLWREKNVRKWSRKKSLTMTCLLTTMYTALYLPHHHYGSMYQILKSAQESKLLSKKVCPKVHTTSFKNQLSYFYSSLFNYGYKINPDCVVRMIKKAR